jgi:hypothetical protein
VRTHGPRLLGAAVRQRRAGLVDAVIELAIPPLALAAASIVAGLAVAARALATGLTTSAPLVIWAAAGLLLAASVVVGFIAARLPAAAWGALVSAPVLVASRVLRLRRVVAYDADSWVRTPRPGEGTGDDTIADPAETPHR